MLLLLVYGNIYCAKPLLLHPIKQVILWVSQAETWPGEFLQVHTACQGWNRTHPQVIRILTVCCELLYCVTKTKVSK